MNVKWNTRALHKHRQRERVGRVTARLEGKTVGDVVIGIPVLSTAQLNQLNWLIAQARDLNEQLVRGMDTLEKSLALLRPEQHVDGWAEVQVLERTPSVLVATVTHRHVPGPKPNKADRRQWRRFHDGYLIRGRRGKTHE